MVYNPDKAKPCMVKRGGLGPVAGFAAGAKSSHPGEGRVGTEGGFMAAKGSGGYFLHHVADGSLGNVNDYLITHGPV